MPLGIRSTAPPEIGSPERRMNDRLADGELLDRQRALQLEAEDVAADLGIRDLVEPLGQQFLVGSAALGLMVWARPRLHGRLPDARRRRRGRRRRTPGDASANPPSRAELLPRRSHHGQRIMEPYLWCDGSSMVVRGS